MTTSSKCIHGVDSQDPCVYCAFSANTLSILNRCRDVLERLEWDGSVYDDCEQLVSGCPVCGKPYHRRVHKPTCELAALLREIPK